MSYNHRLDLAPTQPMLDDNKKHNATWGEYQDRFLELMQQRRVEATVPRELLDNSVLLCSEDKPHHCHRRLVAEYFAQRWEDLKVEHLG
jgi:hypothetical protein